MPPAFHLPDRRRIERDLRRATHGDRDRARDGFRPVVVERFHQHDVAAFVGHRHRRRRDACQRHREHLQFGEGAPHAVAVHQRHSQSGGDVDRHDGIHATRFHAHRRLDRFAQVLTQLQQGVDQIIAAGQFFD